MRIQITARHCDVPDDVLERAREQVGALSKFNPRATSADVVFDEEKVSRKVEVIVHADSSPLVVAHGEAREFRAAVDQVVDRVGRMLREQRKREREHQAPPLQDRVAKD
ncbi:MAG: ribosome-associated translation inhibitor RaiA [Gemmatimonadota bacterium]